MANKPTKKLNKNLKQNHKNLLINPKSRGRWQRRQRTDRKKKKQTATTLMFALMKMF